MKQLDRECCEMCKDLKDKEDLYLITAENLLNNVSNEDSREVEKNQEKLMHEIVTLTNRTKQKLAEKSAIAINVCDQFEKFIRKLDTDSAFFETELKGCGEFEIAKGAEPGTEVIIIYILL
jgi:hypothetical protein